MRAKDDLQNEITGKKTYHLSNDSIQMIVDEVSTFLTSHGTAKKETLKVVLTLRREHKLSSIAQIGLGFLCGVLLGSAMLLLPAETAQDIVDGYISTVVGAFTGLLCVMAAPMCFFAIVLGIVRMGDISSVGNVAKKMMGRLALIALPMALLGALIASSQLFFGSGIFLDSGLRKLFDILLSFVPTNILSPLLNFNSVQIIIVGVMLGASLLALGQKGDNVVKLLDTLNSAAVICNAVYLNRFIPCYVALTVMGIIGARQLAVAPGFLRLATGVLICELLILTFYAAAVYIRLHIPLRVVFRKMAPPFMIALSSASFGAAFSENINTLLALGVEPNYATLGYNVGGVIFRPGGTAVSLAILFSQLGFADEALTLIIPLSMVLEFPTVAIDAFCAKCQVLLLASTAGKIDLTQARAD